MEDKKYSGFDLFYKMQPIKVVMETLQQEPSNTKITWDDPRVVWKPKEKR